MLRKYFKRLFGEARQANLQAHINNSAIEKNRLLTGRMFSFDLKRANLKNMNNAEFSVFSQWGDDGIIQHLIHAINIGKQIFIEFGVENYRESNTRFLLMNDNWSGLIVDGSEDHVKTIQSSEYYWRYDIQAVAKFITMENINKIFLENGMQGPIGLLSIDIDGNDYWVWQAITEVAPDIVIAEYNSLFGSDRAITVPYSPNFYRFDKHYSGLYAGASLPALNLLARQKGYALVGTNSNGNNAYFVKRDLLNSRVKECTIEECFRKSKFRESRDKNGRLTYLNREDATNLISGLKVINVKNDQMETL